MGAEFTGGLLPGRICPMCVVLGVMWMPGSYLSHTTGKYSVVAINGVDAYRRIRSPPHLI